MLCPSTRFTSENIPDARLDFSPDFGRIVTLPVSATGVHPALAQNFLLRLSPHGKVTVLSEGSSIRRQVSESYKGSASAPASCIHGIGFRIRDEGLDPPDTCR